MHLAISIPSTWIAGETRPGIETWTAGDLAVAISPLTPQSSVMTRATPAIAVARHCPPFDGAKFVVESESPFPTELGWPARAVWGQWWIGAAIRGYRFAVYFEMLEHQAVASADADADDLASLERRQPDIAAALACARPVWSEVGGLADIFTGIAAAEGAIRPPESKQPETEPYDAGG